MGGSGTSLKIERLAAGQGGDARELHRAVWERIRDTIYRTCRRRPNRVVLDDYLGSTAYDGLESEDTWRRWESSDTELDFTFWDAAGCCSMSYGAALHWTRMVF